MKAFGTTSDGRDVHALTLSAGDLTVTLLTYGAIVQSVRLAGVNHDLTVGSDRLADYETSMPYNGALIGPVANRLTNAAAPIAGKPHRFEANQDGTHALHSASCGTQGKVWTVADHGPDHATLTLDLPDGEGGYPGNRTITAAFRVSAPARLSLVLTATTDAPTLFNMANHSYWNLDGAPTWVGHSLRIGADHILPINDATIPTGEVLDVTGTPYDFRQARALEPGGPALDHNFCLTGGAGPLREVLWLTGAGGVSMTLATTEPGV